MVDIPNKRVQLFPPSGLLDLTYEEKQKKLSIRGFLPFQVDISPQLRKELELVSKVLSIQYKIPNTNTQKIYQQREEVDIDERETDVNITKLEFLLELSERDKDMLNKYY